MTKIIPSHFKHCGSKQQTLFYAASNTANRNDKDHSKPSDKYHSSIRVCFVCAAFRWQGTESSSGPASSSKPGRADDLRLSQTPLRRDIASRTAFKERESRGILNKYSGHQFHITRLQHTNRRNCTKKKSMYNLKTPVSNCESRLPITQTLELWHHPPADFSRGDGTLLLRSQRLRCLKVWRSQL